MLNLDVLPSKAGACLAVRSNTTHTVSWTVILSALYVSDAEKNLKINKMHILHGVKMTLKSPVPQLKVSSHKGDFQLPGTSNQSPLCFAGSCS